MSDLLSTTIKKSQNSDSFKVTPFQAHGFGIQAKSTASDPATKAELWVNYQAAKQLNQNSAKSLQLQAKLNIGQPGDKYEQEADSVAERVMAMSEPAQLQREELPEEEEELQMKPLENQLSSSKGGGSPLSDEVRSFMEPRFGADFSGVRVHTGSDAVQMNRDVSAQTFVHGNDVYFGAGKAPGKDRLTAHELTHVVQQTGGVQGKWTVQRFPLLPQGGFPKPRFPTPPENVPSSEPVPDDDNFNLAPLVPAGIKLEDLAVLRDLYTQGSKAISEEAKLMVSKGVPAEEVANWAVAARNNLKAKIRDEGPKIVKVIAEARNMKKYGNPLGLTAEELRTQGKTNDQILESVGRSNAGASKWAGRLRIAGRIMIAIDIGMAAYHVATAAEVDRPKVLLEETGAVAGAIAGGELGAAGGIEVGAWIGGMLGGGATIPAGGAGAVPGAALGGGIGGVIGGIGGAIVGAIAGKKLGSFIVEQFYPPAQTAFEGDFQ